MERGKGGTNNILFNRRLNKNIVYHNHTKRKPLAKNDMKKRKKKEKPSNKRKRKGHGEIRIKKKNAKI